MSDLDSAVRAAAFSAVEQALHPVHRTITWARMKMGFVLQGRRWSLVGPQGIFKPAGLDRPLKPVTVPVSGPPALTTTQSGGRTFGLPVATGAGLKVSGKRLATNLRARVG